MKIRQRRARPDWARRSGRERSADAREAFFGWRSYQARLGFAARRGAILNHLLEEAPKALVGVALDLAGGHVECGEERECAAAEVLKHHYECLVETVESAARHIRSDATGSESFWKAL